VEPLQNKIKIPEPSTVPKTIKEVLARDTKHHTDDVMALAKVDVPTYT
jgi:hypothetical protein